MRILFAGTSEIAVPTLRLLAEHLEVGAVLTNTDKPGARGSSLVPPPVKVEALCLRLPVLQFDHLGKDARVAVQAYGCDTLLCFAYGRLFGPKFLSLFENECLNIHPSVLPLLRGPSPIQGAILGQAKQSGISIQRIASEMDCGDLLSTQSFALEGTETTQSLTQLVAEKAAPFALSALTDLARGSAIFTPQQGESSYTTLITTDMAQLDFSLPSRTLHAQIRAMVPWPKARTVYQGQTLLVSEVFGSLWDATGEVVPPGYEPGMVVTKQKGKGIAIATGEGLLWVKRLQLEKRKELDWQSFLNGNRDFLNAKLG